VCEHVFLVKAKNTTQAQLYVEHFLRTYKLIRYDHFEIKADQILVPQDPSFYEELEKETYTTMEDLADIPKNTLVRYSI